MIGTTDGAKKKIINWLKKVEKVIREHTDISSIEIAPAIVLLGIISISLGKAKITPARRWNESDREEIAKFLHTRGVGISLEEFKSILKEEIGRIPEETQNTILNELDNIEDLITKYIQIENPLIPLKEFERRAEIAPLLEYRTFIGREAELKKLHEFLSGENKVCLITGEGGSGKTRLAIEFARQVARDNREVYFINRDIDFKERAISTALNCENVLLILDEASRYHDRNKIAGFVTHIPHILERALAELNLCYALSLHPIIQIFK